MKLYWHLDGWDRRGGRAFATQRERGVDLAELGDAHVPTVYIGPPGFRPEVLASPSIALSACRYGEFEPRVPNSENLPELAFPSADAVAEFVRRGFVSGGRDRGGGGEGGEPIAPRPEGEGPRDTPQIAELTGSNPHADYPKYYAHGQKMLTTLVGNESEFSADAYPLRPTGRGKRKSFRRHAVAAGAAVLIAAMLDAHKQFESTGQVRLWNTFATQLCLSIKELDLWADWLDYPDSSMLPVLSFLKHTAERNVDRAYMAVTKRRRISLLPMLLCSKHSGFGLDAVYFSLDSDFSLTPFVQAALAGELSGNRYEALFSWPLPESLIDHALPMKTVGHLLSVFVSSPVWFKHADTVVFDILDFAASLLASRTTDRRGTTWREEASYAWFERSCPRWAFSADAESLLMDAKNQPATYAYRA